MPILDYLPDPTWSIDLKAENPGSFYGPGFSEYTLSSDEKIMASKHNSGSRNSKAAYHHKWIFDVKYNQLTRDEFNVIYPYLLDHKRLMRRFYIGLPKEDVTAWNHPLASAASAGDTSVVLDTTIGTSPDIYNYAYFSGLTTYDKSYKIVRIHTPSDYVGTAPAVNTIRIDLNTPLVNDLLASDSGSSQSMSIAVKLLDETLSYSIDDKNLYSFRFSAEEVY